MRFARGQALFDNRYDAGRQLARRLDEYREQAVVVLAIPNGGVPVGLEVALALEADLDVVISRKIPRPLNPEAGLGAVADDGTPILDDEIVRELGLSQHQMNYQINEVRMQIRQRSLLYRKDRPLTAVHDKIVIIADDGLASGYTMMAAVESVRRRAPKEIVVAVPVTPVAALERVEKVADRVVTVAIGTMLRFAVADFYHYWYDLSDDEVLQCLKEWRMRRFRSDAESP